MCEVRASKPGSIGQLALAVAVRLEIPVACPTRRPKARDARDPSPRIALAAAAGPPPAVTLTRE